MCLSYLSSAREEMEKHEKRCQLGEGKKKKKGKARALSNILQSWILIVFSVVIWKRDMMWHSLFHLHLTFFVQCSSWGKQTRGDLKKENFFDCRFETFPYNTEAVSEREIVFKHEGDAISICYKNCWVMEQIKYLASCILNVECWILMQREIQIILFWKNEGKANTKKQIPNTKNQTPNTKNKIPKTKHQTLNTKY